MTFRNPELWLADKVIWLWRSSTIMSWQQVLNLLPGCERVKSARERLTLTLQHAEEWNSWQPWNKTSLKHTHIWDGRAISNLPHNEMIGYPQGKLTGRNRNTQRMVLVQPHPSCSGFTPTLKPFQRAFLETKSFTHSDACAPCAPIPAFPDLRNCWRCLLPEESTDGAVQTAGLRAELSQEDRYFLWGQHSCTSPCLALPLHLKVASGQLNALFSRPDLAQSNWNKIRSNFHSKPLRGGGRKN